VFVFVYVLIVANFILNLPLIEERIYLKNKQIEVYKNKTAIMNYLKAKIKNKNYKIYNYMEYGFTYNGKSDYLNTYLKLKKLALQTPAYIIIGERLTAKRSWLKIENLCFNLRYKNYNVEYLGNFKTVHLIKITKNALTN
jgi:hypothetical protein